MIYSFDGFLNISKNQLKSNHLSEKSVIHYKISFQAKTYLALSTILLTSVAMQRSTNF